MPLPPVQFSVSGRMLRLDLEPGHLRHVHRGSILRDLRRSRVRRGRRITTWWDTPDHDLAGTGWVLRVDRDREGAATVALEPVGAGRDALHSGLADPGETLPSDPPAGDLVAMLSERFLSEGGSGPLRPVARARMRVRSWEVAPESAPGGEGRRRSRWRIRVRIERGHLGAEGRRLEVHRVVLELLEGPSSDLRKLALALAEEVPLRLMPMGEAREACLLAGSPGLSPSPPRDGGWQEVRGGLAPDADMEELLRATLRGELRILERVVISAGEVPGVEPGAVHQARLSARRIRALLRLARPLLDPAWSEAVRLEVRQLLGGLARARDLHVLRSEVVAPVEAVSGRWGGESPDLAVLLRHLDAELEQADVQAEQALGSPGVTRLLLLLATGADAAPGSGQAAADFGHRVLRRMEKRLGKRVRAWHHAVARQSGATGSPGSLLPRWSEEDRHELRLRVKRVQDAWRILEPVLPRKRARRRIRILAKLRSRLGTLNDLAVADPVLHALDPRGALLVRGFHLGRRDRLLVGAGEALDRWIGEVARRG